MLRLARIELGWSQEGLGARFGCSGPTISRFENGRRGLRDVAVLRRFASILGLPTEAFGLSDTPTGRPASRNHPILASKVSADHGRDDPVRRRAFLLAAGGVLAGTTVLTGELAAPGVAVDPAVFLARRLEGVLLGSALAAGRPASTSTLLAVLADASADFRACHYVDLAARLPELITAAEATHAQVGEPGSAAVLAQAYNLTTRALIKLDASGLEWVSADRAVRAAAQADDPLIVAEAQRLLGSACRRVGHHDRAQTLTLAAAEQLQLGGRHPDPRHLSLYGVLMCSAGYAAARAGDHDRAGELLDEADATTGRLGGHAARQHALVANVASHRVSAEYVLGNAGTALHHAQAARFARFPDTERRARFLVDVALCFAQWDKPGQAYRSLLAAERAAPGEVRTRATVRRLVADLLQHPHHVGLVGLRDLAARTHALV